MPRRSSIQGLRAAPLAAMLLTTAGKSPGNTDWTCHGELGSDSNRPTSSGRRFSGQLRPRAWAARWNARSPGRQRHWGCCRVELRGPEQSLANRRDPVGVGAGWHGRICLCRVDTLEGYHREHWLCRASRVAIAAAIIPGTRPRLAARPSPSAQTLDLSYTGDRHDQGGATARLVTASRTEDEMGDGSSAEARP
jgi:hypothetical protein